MIATTEEQLVTANEWNVCSFENNVNVEPGDDYILVAFGNGNLSVPTDGSNYIIDSGNTYDSFPTTIDYAGTETSELSIYALYA